MTQLWLMHSLPARSTSVGPPLRSSPVVGLDPTMSMKKTLWERDEWALQRVDATVRFCVATRRSAATSSGEETVP